MCHLHTNKIYFKFYIIKIIIINIMIIISGLCFSQSSIGQSCEKTLAEQSVWSLFGHVCWWFCFLLANIHLFVGQDKPKMMCTENPTVHTILNIKHKYLGFKSNKPKKWGTKKPQLGSIEAFTNAALSYLALLIC